MQLVITSSSRLCQSPTNFNPYATTRHDNITGCGMYIGILIAQLFLIKLSPWYKGNAVKIWPIGCYSFYHAVECKLYVLVRIHYLIHNALPETPQDRCIWICPTQGHHVHRFHRLNILGRLVDILEWEEGHDRNINHKAFLNTLLLQIFHYDILFTTERMHIHFLPHILCILPY